MAGGNFYDRADEPATLYVVQNAARKALKVGIANRDRIDGRLREHVRYGWTTELTLDFEKGHQALQVERAVIAFLRSCGVTSCLPQYDMPQGGYTETFAHSDIADFHIEDLSYLAQLATRLVHRANSPLHAHVLQLLELGDAMMSYAKESRKEEARELWEVLRPAMEETIRALGGE
ncbi:hypothetical protein ACWEOP_36095 [Streptomyces chartreusis]